MLDIGECKLFLTPLPDALTPSPLLPAPPPRTSIRSRTARCGVKKFDNFSAFFFGLLFWRCINRGPGDVGDRSGRPGGQI